MIARRRRPGSPDRAHHDALSDGTGGNPARDAAAETVVRRFAGAARGRAATARRRLAKYQGLPVVDARSVNRAAGISGGLAKQVSTAFHQSGLTRWVAVLLGVWGVLVAGRSLSLTLSGILVFG